MTIFGILWICIIVWGFLKREIKYMLSLTMLFMTFQCANVFVIAGTGIGPQILTSLVFVIKVLIGFGGKIITRKRYRVFILTSLMMFLVSVASCIYNNILTEQALYVIQLFIYVVCFICTMMYAGKIDDETLYLILKRIIAFLLLMGIIQVLTTMEILPLRTILRVLFYNDISTPVYFHHNNYGRIMATFMEPSYFAGLLVGAFYYLLSMSKKWKENYILLAAIVIELIWTLSSTAYAAFVIVGLIFILLQTRVKTFWKIIILAVAGFGFIVLYFGFYSVLDTVIFSKAETGSYLTRMNMNNSALRMYESSPLFGVGYKNVRGSSIAFSLLGQTGILGLVSYLLFNFVVFLPIFLRGRKQFRFSESDIGIRFAVIAAFTSQLIGCPDLDLCTYWFWLYAIGISIRNNQISSKFLHMPGGTALRYT